MADLVRVFAAEAGTTIGDISHPAAAPWPNIILEVEAAASEWAGAEMFRVGGWARNKRTGTVAALGPADGTLTVTAPWAAARNAEFVFPLPGAITDEAQANDIIELNGYVRVGAAIAGADADIEQGEFLFVV